MIDVIKKMKVRNLNVEIYKDRNSMGQAAAFAVAEKIKTFLAGQNEIRMIFAAAPSQNELLENLIKIDGIAWQKITAFHMDEYIGLDDHAPQRFGHFLKERIFGRVLFKQVHYLNPSAVGFQQECARYSILLKEAPIDIICMGIGENGHIAFNDPPVADFNDPETVKIVKLDQMCRQQQVNDGCFASINDVPWQAITLTIPMLFSARSLFIVVPGKTKAQAVRDTLRGSVTTQCPASISKMHGDAVLYLDSDSASELGH